MFGYITPYKPELRMRDWSVYKAYYCGLCHTIRQNYGQLPRLVLNYDFVTVAILADALSGEFPEMKASRCVASPHKKKCYCTKSKGLEIAAACLIITAYYKLYDDTLDERGLKSAAAKAGLSALRKAHRKASLLYSSADSCLKQQTQKQSKLEAEGCQSPDMAAEPTAQMTAAIFEACAYTETQKKPLARLGFMLGKIIYYLDAAEDYEDDKKKCRYNVFSNKTREEANETAAMLCRLCAGDAALSYNLLEFKANKDILDNIIFLGIAQSVENAGKKRGKEKITES